MATNIGRSVRAMADAATGSEGVVDWGAVAEAAKGATEPGELSVSAAEREAFADDVRAARDGLQAVGGIEFELPDRIEVQNRHHWIDANAATFARVVEPLEARAGAGLFPGVARTVNTGTMAVSLAFLARNVMGQYDPTLFSDGEHALYFVRPNVLQVTGELDVEYPRFRRWIAFHEVAHAAEFSAAPWLSGYLEDRIEETIADLSEGSFDRAQFREVNVAMTAVEGYAELLMDRAFDAEYADLRAKLDDRRGGGTPLARLFRRLLGLGVKRQQYERGAAFFEHVADEAGVETAARVWDAPEFLPTEAELDDPDAWLARID